MSAASTTVAAASDLPELDPTGYSNASDHYGLLWWNNLDGTLDRVPTDAYWSWGLYDSLIAVIPSLDIVVARAGNSWQQEWKANYEVLKPFLYPIVAAVNDEHSLMATQNPTDGFPYPPSPVIKGLEWAPVSTILRQAKGSDNWPITWGDDGRLYTAYGDGWGFEPGAATKLSMGLGIISGDPDNFQGENLRAPTAERLGGGASGPKVSGLLMVDGVLYMLVRNTGNSQLAWSIDRGQTWTWSDWKFTTSFGYPTFLNFGQNYAKARDEYIYIYSPDSESAYQRVDRMVLARALVKLIRMRTSSLKDMTGRHQFGRMISTSGVRSLDMQKTVTDRRLATMPPYAATSGAKPDQVPTLGWAEDWPSMMPPSRGGRGPRSSSHLNGTWD